MIENNLIAVVDLWKLAMSATGFITIMSLAFTLMGRAGRKKEDETKVARLCVCGKFCQVPHICDGECQKTEWN